MKSHVLVVGCISVAVNVFSTIKTINSTFRNQVWLETKPLKYSVVNLIDGRKETCFSFKNERLHAQHQELAYIYLEGNLRFDQIVFLNGYQKSPTLFRKNARVKDICIKSLKKYKNKNYLEGFEYKTNHKKIVQLNDNTKRYSVEMKTRNCDLLQISVLSVYRGLEHNDVCISEIEFYYKGKNIPIKNLSEIKKNYLKKLHEYYQDKIIRTEQKPFTKKWWYYSTSGGRLGFVSFAKNGNLKVFKSKYKYSDYNLGKLNFSKVTSSLKPPVVHKWYCKGGYIWFVVKGKHYKVQYATGSRDTYPAIKTWGWPRHNTLTIKNTPLAGKYINEFNPM